LKSRLTFEKYRPVSALWTTYHMLDASTLDNATKTHTRSTHPQPPLCPKSPSRSSTWRPSAAPAPTRPPPPRPPRRPRCWTAGWWGAMRTGGGTRSSRSSHPTTNSGGCRGACHFTLIHSALAFSTSTSSVPTVRLNRHQLTDSYTQHCTIAAEPTPGCSPSPGARCARPSKTRSKRCPSAAPSWPRRAWRWRRWRGDWRSRSRRARRRRMPGGSTGG